MLPIHACTLNMVSVVAEHPRLCVRRAIGGLDAEREERALIKQEKEARDRHNFEGMQAIRREGYRKVGPGGRGTGWKVGLAPR